MKLVSKFENIAGYEHPNKNLPAGQSYLLLDERSDNKNRTGATFMQTLSKDGGAVLGAIFKTVAQLQNDHGLKFTPQDNDAGISQQADALLVLNAVNERVTDNRISHNTYLHSHVVMFEKENENPLQYVLDENAYAQNPLGTLNDLLPDDFEKKASGQAVSIHDVKEAQRGAGFHKIILVDKPDTKSLSVDMEALTRVRNCLLAFGQDAEARHGMRLVLDTQNFPSYMDKDGNERKAVALHMLGDFKEDKIETPKGMKNRRWFQKRQDGPSGP